MDPYAAVGAIMNIEVITSFNQHYYDMIGRDAVISYLNNWDLDLTVYAESCQIPNHPRVKIIDFDELGQDYEDFQADQTVSKRCKIFAKKAFSVIHAMYHSQADWLVWIDADTLTVKKHPEHVLQQILKPSFLAMYMGVRYTTHRNVKFGQWLVPETGFFGVNLQHADLPRFRDEYQRRYLERDFADLRRSYDNDVFGAVIEAVPAEYLDLCADLAKPYKTPLKHTIFGAHLHHYKAKHSKVFYSEAQ